GHDVIAPRGAKDSARGKRSAAPGLLMDKKGVLRGRERAGHTGRIVLRTLSRPSQGGIPSLFPTTRGGAALAPGWALARRWRGWASWLRMDTLWLFPGIKIWVTGRLRRRVSLRISRERKALGGSVG